MCIVSFSACASSRSFSLSTVVLLCSTDGGEGQHPTTHREFCHQAADGLPLHRQHHLQVAVTHMLRAHRHFEHIVCAQTVSLLNQHVCHAGPARSCRLQVGNSQEATAVSDVCCVCAAWILLWVSEAATACRSLTHRRNSSSAHYRAPLQLYYYSALSAGAHSLSK